MRVVYVSLTFELLFTISYQSDLSIKCYVFSKSNTLKLHLKDNKTAGINIHNFDYLYLDDKAKLAAHNREYPE